MTRTLLLIAFTIAPLFGADATEPIRTLLTSKCQGCHNDRNRMGGLSLASTADMRKGGKRGPAVVPGKPEQSILFQMISSGTPRMPMGGDPLNPSQLEMIRAWIANGAPWVDNEVWWSLRPLVRPAVPEAGDGWAHTPVDHFVLANLREKGLTHSETADPRTLIRRVTYDLHGLPPSPEEVEAFIADRSPDAYEKLVDRLLSSPRYGERWGRHWLDVAHYGESHGYDKDKPRRNAWPYRDYVIRAFNEDKPYTRFVQEQLAGDTLFPDSPEAVTALGFVAGGPWDFVGQAELREGTTDKNLTRVLDRDDMVTVTMSAFASMTAHCARCHDHKFDPIRQSEYYGLQAVFAGVDRADRPFDDNPVLFAQRNQIMANKRALVAQLRPLEDEAAAVTSPEIEALDQQVRDWKEISSDNPALRPADIKQKIADAVERRKAMVMALLPKEKIAEMDRLRAETASVEAQIKKLPTPRLVYAAANYFDPQGTFRFAIDPRPVTVLQRGNVDNPGPVATPGALACVPGLQSQFTDVVAGTEGARRAALAQWIIDPKNTLTWRSIVNRVWHYHFGAGLVDTPNDFGHMGSQPTDPALLDWLATEFRDSGGSFKRLHKLILMSATYRQSSNDIAANSKVDGDNRYLWRGNRQRLDAEELRDSILTVSGKLDLTMGGPSVEQFFFKDDHSPVYDYARFDPDSVANYRRSVYRFLVRSVPDPLMERFDCPDISMVTAKRNTTITAIQALALMNNPFVLKQAGHFAERVQAVSNSADGQVKEAYRLALAREPQPAELNELRNYLSHHGLINLCRLILNTNEFLFVD